MGPARAIYLNFSAGMTDDEGVRPRGGWIRSTFIDPFGSDRTSRKMGFVALEALGEGRVLAADVHDINGRLLLSKGQVIAAKHLRVLKIWGVT